MIGIQAMAVIAEKTGNTEDAANYSNIAHDYITKWQDLAIAKDATPPHTTLSYGDINSHGSYILFPLVHANILTQAAGLLYNLFADAQLGLGLVPQSVYQMQSDFYQTVENKYGVPLDTRHTYTKGKKIIVVYELRSNANVVIGDWECFTAAITSGNARSMFIRDLATWINETPTNRPLTDLYDTISGK
jgi:hypothetical protein